MATKKKTQEDTQWPKVIKGSHSVRTEYEDGRVEFESNWDDLVKDVMAAIQEYEQSQPKGEENGKTRKTRKSK